MECALDLERHGQLIRITEEVDPFLEMAEIHRRIFEKQGPAILFEKVKNSPFKAISNVYGTYQRTEWIFRKTLPAVQKVIELKFDPSKFLKHPFRYLQAPFTALTALPQQSLFSKPILYGECKISDLPQVHSWKMDGGAFVTLPQVFSEDPDNSSLLKSNIGMYRIQLSGNEYIDNEEVGLHYQLHRGIGVHHQRYNELDKPFKVSVFVGGPPSHAFSAIMPLPEGLSELTFAGMLAGRRFRYTRKNGYFLSSDADFCITGTVVKGLKKPEGPFGDHLGYYSLTHDFPVLQVDKVYHRKDALWHFTVVGRPPAEDSSFGHLIHLLVKSLSSQEFPGLHEIHAVDAAGVHPLLLAIGKERYMPFREPKPEEILTIANHVLGSGQTSLSKYLWIVATDPDAPNLNTKNIPAFFQHILERVDWSRDVHFQTKTTIDTLDYSGSGWNEGSKVVIAACGTKKRTLGNKIPENLRLPTSFTKVALPFAGVLVIQAPKFEQYPDRSVDELIQLLEHQNLSEFPLIVLSEDAEFAAATINNFVWVTFTRSNPSHDIHGVNSFTEYKHWGCRGSLIIDARIKPHHAPPLETDAVVSEHVDRLFKKGAVLEKWG